MCDIPHKSEVIECYATAEVPLCDVIGLRSHAPEWSRAPEKSHAPDMKKVFTERKKVLTSLFENSTS